jgi:hypothetical protein
MATGGMILDLPKANYKVWRYGLVDSSPVTADRERRRC